MGSSYPKDLDLIFFTAMIMLPLFIVRNRWNMGEFLFSAMVMVSATHLEEDGELFHLKLNSWDAFYYSFYVWCTVKFSHDNWISRIPS